MTTPFDSEHGKQTMTLGAESSPAKVEGVEGVNERIVIIRPVFDVRPQSSEGVKYDEDEAFEEFMKQLPTPPD